VDDVLRHPVSSIFRVLLPDVASDSSQLAILDAVSPAASLVQLLCSWRRGV
jgi:hypothetical protein